MSGSLGAKASLVQGGVVMKMNNILVLFMIMATLFGCGSPRGGGAGGGAGGAGGGAASGTGSTPPPIAVAGAQLVLSASPGSVKSDNSSVSVITATVLDANNAVVNGTAVTFSATVGQLSAATGTTDATGQAAVNFSSGANKTNQVATITATLTGANPTVTGQIPVQIAGSTVTMTSVTSSLTAATSDTLTITVKDAGGIPIPKVPVAITQAGAGSVSVAPAVLTTDASGVVVATVTGATAGSVTLSVSSVGASASHVYTVSNPAAAFAITAPATDPLPLSAGIPVIVSVQAPGGIANVTFAASMGAWDGGASSTVTKPVVAGLVSASFVSSQAGVATIQVFDAANIATTDQMTIAVSQPAVNATQITLQSNVNVVAPSSGGITNTATLTATVRDINGQIVGGAPVAFSIPNSTGGGEFVSPIVVLTDFLGKASTTFTAGSGSTGAQGVNVQATLLNPVGILPAVSNIVIGGTAGSVTIGRANKVIVGSTTVYDLPMSVLIADSNGNAVAGATVSLKAFPSKFRTGTWINASYTSGASLVSQWLPCITGTFPNEDVNRNLILDFGEDVSHTTVGSTCTVNSTVIPPVLVVGGQPIVYAANTILDPPNSAAGTLPQTVTTDARGVANFVLTYLKGSSLWIETEVTASTLVLGTETTANIKFWLPAAKADVDTGNLPNSVFGR